MLVSVKLLQLNSGAGKLSTEKYLHDLIEMHKMYRRLFVAQL